MYKSNTLSDTHRHLSEYPSVVYVQIVKNNPENPLFIFFPSQNDLICQLSYLWFLLLDCRESEGCYNSKIAINLTSYIN